MAEYVVFCAIRSLSELLLYEAKNVPQLRGRIEVIQMKLRRLQSILEIADARKEVDEGIRNWVAETTEVAYDIEDLLLVAVSSRREGTSLKKYTNLFKNVTNLRHLEPTIQVIEAKVSALESDLRVRNIKPRQKGISNPVSRKRQQQRRTYSHHVEEDFVGLDDDVEQLVGKLVKEEDANRNYQVVSITGMGGIGKTTIAKKIYHHVDIRSHFHAFAWACVSQQWQQEDVLQRILHELEPEKKKEINNMKVEELVEGLFEVQKRKRCLIVLDDVWEIDVWDILRPAFPTRQVNIKVLLTTRNKEIARYIDMDAPCYLYEQRHLNEKESWELLKKKVYRSLLIAGISLDNSHAGSRSVEEHEYCSGFEDDDALSCVESFHSCISDEEEDEPVGRLHKSSSELSSQEDQRNQMDMERLGKEMAGECGGLPLAIIVLGGLLLTKSTINEWRTVHQNFNSYLRKGRSSRENGRIHEVLALSYHDLPYQLKPCFLHLGNFPEDSQIPTQKLYQLWAAEGFISQESSQAEEDESIMDIAERYLAELVQRCMVQVRVEVATGRFKSCGLHDLTRELCLVKCKEENFLKKVPLRYEPELMSTPSPSAIARSISKTRRITIAVDYDFDSYFPPRKENLEHIRSALFFSRLSGRKNLQPALQFVCNEFKLVRVLDLERFDFGEKLCKGIGNLVQLRYLSLRGSQLYKLPSSIGNLKYLQTLDLRVPFLVCVTIPNVIWKLNHLKHLYLPPSHKSTGKLQLNSLSKLEILKNFDTRVSDYRDITKLTKLQKLAATLTLEIENLAALINCLEMEHRHIRDPSFRIRCDFQSEKEFTVLRQIVGFIHLHKLDLIGVINRLPEDCHFAPSLTKLTLRSSRLKEDPMTTLEKLPHLHTLILRNKAFEGNEICCSSQGFPSLSILELQGLTSLEYWRIEERAMPNLYCLKIDECINLRMVPEGIKFIVSLRELVIVNMPDAFKCRVQNVPEEGGEDFYKVRHIPSVTITETSRSYMKKLESSLSGNSYSGLFQSFSPSLIPKDWQNFSGMMLASAGTSLPAVEMHKKNDAVISEISPADFAASISEDQSEQQSAAEITEEGITLEDSKTKMSRSSIEQETGQHTVNENVPVSESDFDSQQAVEIESESYAEIQIVHEMKTLTGAESVSGEQREIESTSSKIERNKHHEESILSPITTDFVPEKEHYLVFVKDNHIKLKLDHQTILVGDCPPSSPPESSLVKAVLNLAERDLRELPEKPDYPSTLVLFLQRNNRLTLIHSSFFDSMPDLIFLDLSDTRIRILPSSLFGLSKLKVLMLRNCASLDELPSEIGKLNHLEVLDLSGTELYSLPDEIKQLAHLRHVQLSLYGPDDESEYAHLPPKLISHGVLSELKTLEAISIIVHPQDHRWTEIAKGIMKDVGSLGRLSSIQFYFPEVECLQDFILMSPSWKEQGLSKFKFIVGHNVKRIVSRVPVQVESLFHQHDRCLKLVNSVEVFQVIKTVLRHATAFYLDHHIKIKSLSEFGLSTFQALKFCAVRECPKIQVILDEKETEGAFPSLEHLGVYYLWELEHMWKSPLPAGSFQVLKYLIVNTCPKLKFILWKSMLQCLSNLEELLVENCARLEKIIEEDEKKVNYDSMVLPKLRKLVLRFLPNLVSLGNGLCPSKEIIVTYACPKFN